MENQNEDTDITFPKGFFVTPGWAYSRGISFADIGLYNLIGLFSNYDADTNRFQRCSQSKSVLARIGGCSINTVEQSLARLVNAGLIEHHERYSEDGSQLPSEYTIRSVAVR